MGIWKLIRLEKLKLYKIANQIQIIPQEFITSDGMINLEQINKEIDLYK